MPPKVTIEYPEIRLSNANQKAIDDAVDPDGLKDRQSFVDEASIQQTKAVKLWYERGGRRFFNWVKKYYRNWSGQLLTWDDPFAPELFILIGNPWVTLLYAEKPAQVGWTEAVIALNAFALAELRIPVGFGVEQAQKLTDLVGPRIQKALDHCEPVQKLRSSYKTKVGRKDTDTKQRHITVAGVLSTYFYASTASGGKKDPSAHRERQAPSAMSSFTAFLIICDEIELWPPGAMDIATKRQEASHLPTKPMRAGSTPGAEGGIVDSFMKSSKHLFLWQVVCPHCNVAQPLDPFGNLLRPEIIEDNGMKEERYLDLRGYPLKWFHHDPTEPITTAYVGCSHCEKELSKKAINAGKFICQNTGESLLDLCDRTVREQAPIYQPVAIRIPKLATKRFDARERISKLVNSRNRADEIQQGLGRAVSIGGGRINLTSILKSVGKKIPENVAGWEQKIIVGCDQGQAANYIVVARYFLPPDFEDNIDRWYRSYAEIIYYDQVADGALSNFASIKRTVAEYEGQIVGMDLNPETAKAGEFGRLHPPDGDEDYPVFLFGQCALGTGQRFHRTEKNIQGVETVIFRLDRTAGLDAVRDRFYNGYISLPAGLQHNPSDPNNFIYHFQTSEKLSSGKWVESPGDPDHYFHAFNFCEMALLCYLHEHISRITFGGLKR